MAYLHNRPGEQMKIVIILCLSLIASLQFVQAEAMIIGNNSRVDFSSLSSGNSASTFTVEAKTTTDMIIGNITVLISDVKWDDHEMADYQQRYGSNPHQIIIAAFNEKQQATPSEQAEIFSTRDGSQLLYLYISELESNKTGDNIALFFTEDAQKWFVEQGMMAIPEVVYQQNLVTLGLKEAEFEGGYK